jgi:phosphatidylserine decarboxylase
MPVHEYVCRRTGAPIAERPFGDAAVRLLYSRAREHAPWLFEALTSRGATRLLGWLHFDSPLTSRFQRRWLARSGIDLSECLDSPAGFRTPRDVFERRIRYWECRPLPADPDWVVSPADARVAVGSLADGSPLRLKGRFFDFEELLGPDRGGWLEVFRGGDFAVFRLTPERYHWNHAPVSGRVLDRYELPGVYHACNPTAVIELATPCSKNRRVVTVIDTDVPGGTGVGRVAMIEVVALLVGVVEQRYCASRYDDPRPVEPGLFVERGQPKSLYRPGSSTDVLLFEPGRVRFADDLLAHRGRTDACSRFSLALGAPLVETDVLVRSPLARRTGAEPTHA